MKATDLPVFDRARRGLLPFLGMASGASVATIYYNQPLLLEITRTFHVSPGSGGAIAVATQLGYAAGILLFVPLGDVVERRKLILRLFAAVSLALVAAGLAPSFWALVAASVVIGVTASVTHILVPIAPELADPGEGGRAIGTVMSGLLLGVLLGRAASGAVAEALGWRAVFLLAAVSTGAFVPLLWWRMPPLPPPRPVRYGAALRSLWDLVCARACIAGSFDGELSGFRLVYRLLDKSRVLSRFAALSLGRGRRRQLRVAGCRWSRGGFPRRAGWPTVTEPRVTLTLALGLLSAGYVLLWVFGYHIAGLIAGVIVLDAGQQAMQISNQTRIFALSSTARSRINTVYMIIFFLGGALGSALSAAAWSRWQWGGVCGWGLAMLALAWLRHGYGYGDHAPPARP